MTQPNSKNSLKGEITRVSPGIAIYQVGASPFWMARIRNHVTKKYIVRSTKETSKLKARDVALELASDLLVRNAIPREYTFKYFAQRFIETGKRLIAEGERNANYIRTTRLMLDNDKWGLMKEFGARDVRQIKTRHWIEFLNKIGKDRPDLSPSTKSHLSATFRNVMKEARVDGTIDDVPDTPRTKVRDNPRPFFRFFPLVPKDQDAIERLQKVAMDMAFEKVVIRGVEVTSELSDVIRFVVYSFVRPIVSELYAIRFQDIAVATNPKRLLVTIRDGKTGFRIANTMPLAIFPYQNIIDRRGKVKPEDYLFLPDYQNRETAGKIIQRQFRALLKRANLETDLFTGKKHSIYSLRHTAICMRIIQSEGGVNIFNLAKNAGTSVEQIERFYAKHLPLSAELARNLHLGGDNASYLSESEALRYEEEIRKS